MAIASFTQTAAAQSCGDEGVVCDDFGNIIDDGSTVDLDGITVEGTPLDDPGYTDPFEDFDPLFPDEPCSLDCGDDGGDGGGGGGDSSSSYDPVVCNGLLNGSSNPNYVPGNPNAPIWCSTNPGGPQDQNYSDFIDNNMSQILTTAFIDNSLSCFMNPNSCLPTIMDYPYMTEATAQNVIHQFARQYYLSNDYVLARNSVWITLSYTCIAPYWASQPSTPEQSQAFSECITTQYDFMMSMAPETEYNSQWTLGLQYNIPWGGSISLNLGNNFQFRDWSSSLITQVSKASRCHTWYQALEAANCPAP